MSIWVTLLLVVQVISAVGVIVLVLLQQGKGADMGAAFGSGASGSLFGATGSANFLSRTTAILATVFFLTTLSLAYFSGQRPVQKESGGVMGSVQQAPAGSAAPAGVPQPSAVPTPSGTAAPAAPAAGGAAESKPADAAKGSEASK